MPKPARIQSSNALLKVTDLSGVEFDIGVVDTFHAKDLAELKTSQAIGQVDITSQAVFKGWELTFEGGKINWNLASLIHNQDSQIGNAGRSPYFNVLQRVTFFDGTIEEYQYFNVTIHGYELNVPNQDQLTEHFTGFSGSHRKAGDAVAAASATINSSVGAILKAMNGLEDRRSRDNAGAGN